ncbi:hypothetical protein NB640_03755 [Oxalobacter vibrioformis]|uniref:Uncharacterized protein n=1 Tax=Oxalobacter vibrioformis TaxID=933080 RepID=A0A9E9M1G9_9BURK|nr:hypothetical protein [Oxalobacter vibrioformis]WAW10778.1 hypothetical protein NB640_03755 [Oxalobacter vibrioformis]
MRYHVFQKKHRFLREKGRTFRKNKIWCDTHTKGHAPRLINSKPLYANRVVVKYPVADEMLE